MEDMVVLFMTSRPEWMTFDEYKKLQKLQRKLSKIVKKGRFEWVSKIHRIQVLSAKYYTIITTC